MSVYKPKNSPYWHYDFQIAGERFHGSTHRETKEEAKDFEAQKRLEARNRSERVDNSDMPLREAIGRYWNEHGKFQKSADDIFEKLERICDGIGPNKMLRSLSNSDLSTYVTKRRTDVSPASVNRELTYLRAVHNRATLFWDIVLPRLNWKAQMLAEPKHRTRHLKGDEGERIWKELNEDFKNLADFCLETAVRVSAARGLQWPDVDEAGGEITLYKKSRQKDDVHVIPITPNIKAVIDRVRGQHAKYVFTFLCQNKGNKNRTVGKRYPFSRDGWRRSWYTALKRAKVTNFRFHDLRHTAATQMLAATKNIAGVQKVLGHSEIQTTMRYAHVLNDDLIDTLSRKSPEKKRGEVEEKPETDKENSGL